MRWSQDLHGEFQVQDAWREAVSWQPKIKTQNILKINSGSRPGPLELRNWIQAYPRKTLLSNFKTGGDCLGLHGMARFTCRRQDTVGRQLQRARTRTWIHQNSHGDRQGTQRERQGVWGRRTTMAPLDPFALLPALLLPFIVHVRVPPALPLPFLSNIPNVVIKWGRMKDYYKTGLLWLASKAQSHGYIYFL